MSANPELNRRDAETPRTTAKQFEMLSDLQSGMRYVVSADFAKELERELNSLRNAVFDLCGHLPGVSDEQMLANTKVALHQLLHFAGKILAAHRAELTDVSGDTIQDEAIACGLLEQRTATEPCGDRCTCAEVKDFPLQCYFPTALGQQALNRATETTNPPT